MGAKLPTASGSEAKGATGGCHCKGGASAAHCPAPFILLAGSKSPTSSDDGQPLPADPRRQSALLHATAGAIAGAISRFVVGPLDVLKIRFQVQLEPISGCAAAMVPSKYTSIHQALVTIVREEGIKGLWRGTVPGQLLTIPYTAIQVGSCSTS